MLTRRRLTAPRSERVAQKVVSIQSYHCLGESCRVIRLHEQTSFTVLHEFGDPADAGADDCLGEGHSLEENEAEGLLPRSVDEELGAHVESQRLRMLHVTREEHA